MALLNLIRLFRTKRARCYGGSCLILATIMSVTVPAMGQTYQESKQLPLPEEFKDRRSVSRMRLEKNNAVRDGIAIESNKAVLDNFYLGFMFRALTREEYADSVAALRLELLRDIDRADTDTRKHLESIAYRGGTGLLRDPRFHPAAHINAVLLLGELNQQQGAGSNSAPIPYSAVTKLLAELVASDKHSEPVRIAALQALDRHVRLRGPAKGAGALTKEERDQLRAVAMGLLSQTDVPAVRTPEAHAWIRNQAIQFLAILGDAGPDGEVIKALSTIVVDPKSAVDLRATAIEALGTIDTTTWEEDPTKFVGPVARLLIDILTAELDEMAGQSRAGGGRGDGPGGAIDENSLTDPSTREFRRRLLPRLSQLDRGLNGDSRTGRAGIIATLGPGPFESIVAGLKKSKDAAMDLTSTMDEFGYQLDEVRNGLEEQFPDPTRRNSGQRGRNR